MLSRHFLLLSLLAATMATTAAAEQPKFRKHAQGTNQYVVLLPASTPTATIERAAHALAGRYKVDITQIWPYAVKGFLCTGTEENLRALADDVDVEVVEQNIRFKVPPQVAAANQQTTYNGQYLWYLDRLDEPSYGPSYMSSGHDSSYNMCPEAVGRYAYVIDYGVWRDSAQFGSPSRVVRQKDFTNDTTTGEDTTNGCSTSFYTGNEHGTWVAGTLAGYDATVGRGVGATKANIVSLKVIRCDSYSDSSWYLAALDWIASPSNPYRYQPGIINHSGFVWSFDVNFYAYSAAVGRVVAQENLPFFASAGNFSADACQFSPQNDAYTNINHSGHVFVVGGTNVSTNSSDPYDYRWQQWQSNGQSIIGRNSGSNSGACVSAYAPAVDVYVAGNRPASGYTLQRGTSFSSPLAAGVALRYIDRQIAQTGVRPSYTQVYDFLLGQAALSPFTVQQTQTPRSYFICYVPDNGVIYTSDTYPSGCPTGTIGPIDMNSAGNTSNAKMLWWDASCP